MQKPVDEIKIKNSIKLNLKKSIYSQKKKKRTIPAWMISLIGYQPCRVQPDF